MRSARARRVFLVRKIFGFAADRWRGVSSCARPCSVSVLRYEFAEEMTGGGIGTHRTATLVDQLEAH